MCWFSGDVVNILHVIAPSRTLVVNPDMGLEGVIEDDEETKRKVVRRTPVTIILHRNSQTYSA